MANIEGKVWGTTECFLSTPLFEIHRLEILPNAQCSVHKHHYKWNAFLVIEGELTIEIEKGDYQLTDKTVLRPGGFTTVKPGEFHQFKTGPKPCVAYEIYYCEPLSKDIVRRTVGSVGKKRPRKR